MRKSSQPHRRGGRSQVDVILLLRCCTYLKELQPSSFRYLLFRLRDPACKTYDSRWLQIIRRLAILQVLLYFIALFRQSAVLRMAACE